MKKDLLLLLLMVPAYMWGQVSVNSIKELRQLADQTEVSYQVTGPDTVYATTDGRICLTDGTFILTEGLEGAKAGLMLTGLISGTKSSMGGYPLLLVNDTTSNYELFGREESWCIIDLDEYEKAMGSQKEEPKEEQPPTDTIQGIPTVDGIMAFRQLENGTEARVQLHCDTILFVGNDDAYLRGDAAICLRGTNLPLKVGMLLRGTLIGIKGEQDGVPLLLPSEHTTDAYYLTDYSVNIKDHYLNFSDLEPNVGDVVTIDDVVVDSLPGIDGSRCLYLCKGIEQLPVVDLYGLCKQQIPVPAHCSSMKAVLSAGSRSMQLFPTANLSEIVTPLSIQLVKNPNNPTAPLFDLQGRRIYGQPAKGMYIKGGKKFVK